jgi:hypothetical protein
MVILTPLRLILTLLKCRGAGAEAPNLARWNSALATASTPRPIHTIAVDVDMIAWVDLAERRHAARLFSRPIKRTPHIW